MARAIRRVLVYTKIKLSVHKTKAAINGRFSFARSNGSVIVGQSVFDSRSTMTWVRFISQTDHADQITPEKTKPKIQTHPLRKKSFLPRLEFRSGVWRPPTSSHTILCDYGFYFVKSDYVCCQIKNLNYYGNCIEFW